MVPCEGAQTFDVGNGRECRLLDRECGALAVAPRPPAACREAFHGAWVTQGLWIRDTFAVDELLIDVLRNLLPGHSGSAMVLYRGDRWSNYEARSYGVSWTSKRSAAEMFALGLNRCPVTEGVLLRTAAPASAILAAPNAGRSRACATLWRNGRGC